MRTALALLLIAIPALGDVVHLTNGGKVQGNVTEEGDLYVVDTGWGTVKIRKSEVARIEKKPFDAPPRPVFTRRPPRLRESFTHPFYAFKIFLPGGWHKSSDREKQKITFVGPKDQMLVPHMDLSIHVTPTPLDEFANKLRNAFLKDYKDVLFTFEEKFAIRGGDALQFIVLLTDGGIRMRSLWTLARRDDRLYVLGFTISDAWFDRYHSALDASMRSLRLFDVPSAPLAQRQEFERLYREGSEASAGGMREEALRAFARAAELIPEFPDVHNVIGQLSARTGDPARAERAFRKAHGLDPDDHEFAFNLGVILLQAQKWEEAATVLGLAVQADPSREPALTNLGVAFLARRRHDQALEVLQKAVAADPESGTAHYNLGIAFERLERGRDAESEYRETLKIDPEHKGAMQALERLKK